MSSSDNLSEQPSFALQECLFTAVGMRFYGNYHFRADEDIMLMPDPDNTFDSNAIQLLTRNKVRAYVSRENTRTIKKLLDSCTHYSIELIQHFANSAFMRLTCIIMYQTRNNNRTESKFVNCILPDNRDDIFFFKPYNDIFSIGKVKIHKKIGRSTSCYNIQNNLCEINSRSMLPLTNIPPTEKQLLCAQLESVNERFSDFHIGPQE